MTYQIHNGSVSYDSDVILERVDFEIRDREKIAIVGRNGCGKTTLLKAILGEVEMEEGTGDTPFSVVRAGNPTVGYLRQIVFPDGSVPMEEEVRGVFGGLIAMETRLAALEEAMQSATDPHILAEYDTLRERFIREGGQTYRKEYLTMIRSFGFTDADRAKPIGTFSGGQRTKIAFIKLLLSKPDILLLDEPTNHLDIETVRWLEDYLRAYPSAVVIVSHDRLFLDRVVGRVYEIEWGETHAYAGGYSAFLRQKAEQHRIQAKDHEAQQKEIRRLTALIERFRYKATKAKMVQSKIKLLERMQRVDLPDRYDLRTFHADFQPEEPGVLRVLDVRELVVGYDKPLATVNFSLQRGQKLGIIGANGIGKSTLLKTLVGKVAPLGGTYTFGYGAKIGYFDQQEAQLEAAGTVFSAFSAAFPHLNDREVRSALGAFQFSGEDVFKEVSDLSGGERVRLALCTIFRRRPNVLILDEPTNHMDIVGKETLEMMLAEYTGTLIFVSHDRYFVNRLADRLLVFTDTGVRDFPGTYHDWEETRRAAEAAAAALPVPERESAPKTSRRGTGSPLRERGKKERRVARLEELIAAGERRAAELSERLADPAVYADYEQVAAIEAQRQALLAENDGYTEEWAALTEELAQDGTER